MIPRPSKNGSNFCQKRPLKIQARRHQNRSPEGSKAGLEAPWAVLRQLGRFWKRLGPSWRHLGRVLEGSWAVLGRERWPTWIQLGFQKATTINNKSAQKLINFMMALGMDVFRFFSDFWLQKSSHVGSKMYKKSILS